MIKKLSGKEFHIFSEEKCGSPMKVGVLSVFLFSFFLRIRCPNFDEIELFLGFEILLCHLDFNFS